MEAECSNPDCTVSIRACTPLCTLLAPLRSARALRQLFGSRIRLRLRDDQSKPCRQFDPEAGDEDGVAAAAQSTPNVHA